MGSLDKIIRLANRFSRKLSLAQQKQPGPQVLEDPKAVVADAFFGPTGRGRSEKDFMAFLGTERSKFQQAIANVKGTINIGATVNAPAKTADFLVSVPGAQGTAIKNALIADYTVFYGKPPVQQLQARLADGTVKPDVVASHPAIITF